MLCKQKKLKDAAESSGIEFHHISEGKKQSVYLGEITGTKVYISKPRIQVPWIRRRHGRQKHEKETGIYPASID